MIKILKSEKEIKIIGHAGYDEYGKDIVCSAVSTLIDTTISYFEELNKNFYYEVSNGYAKIKLGDDDIVANKIFKRMCNILKDLTEQYPRNIEMECVK